MSPCSASSAPANGSATASYRRTMDEDVPLLAALGLAVLQCVLGAAVSLTTRRAADGRLGRNALVGIRTRATMGSDAAWRDGHAAAVPLADLAGLAFLLGGVLVGTALLLVGTRRAGRAAAAAD